jgi:hypothetical protein
MEIRYLHLSFLFTKYLKNGINKNLENLSKINFSLKDRNTIIILWNSQHEMWLKDSFSINK